eukprot:scaffold29867_cov43-Phaeocystis_antarctica.AAC.2
MMSQRRSAGSSGNRLRENGVEITIPYAPMRHRGFYVLYQAQCAGTVHSAQVGEATRRAIGEEHLHVTNRASHSAHLSVDGGVHLSRGGLRESEVVQGDPVGPRPDRGELAGVGELARCQESAQVVELMRRLRVACGEVRHGRALVHGLGGRRPEAEREGVEQDKHVMVLTFGTAAAAPGDLDELRLSVIADDALVVRMSRGVTGGCGVWDDALVVRMSVPRAPTAGMQHRARTEGARAL